MNDLQEHLKAITTAHTDYVKASFEQGKAHIEKLASVKSVDEAVGLQTEYSKAALATFMAEATKIGDLYKTLAKDACAPFAAGFPKGTT